jgi:hypothetical protein
MHTQDSAGDGKDHTAKAPAPLPSPARTEPPVSTPLAAGLALLAGVALGAWATYGIIASRRSRMDRLVDAITAPSAAPARAALRSAALSLVLFGATALGKRAITKLASSE